MVRNKGVGGIDEREVVELKRLSDSAPRRIITLGIEWEVSTASRQTIGNTQTGRRQA